MATHILDRWRESNKELFYPPQTLIYGVKDVLGYCGIGDLLNGITGFHWTDWASIRLDKSLLPIPGMECVVLLIEPRELYGPRIATFEFRGKQVEARLVNVQNSLGVAMLTDIRKVRQCS